jgi:hypothetical protein
VVGQLTLWHFIQALNDTFCYGSLEGVHTAIDDLHTHGLHCMKFKSCLKQVIVKVVAPPGQAVEWLRLLLDRESIFKSMRYRFLCPFKCLAARRYSE